MMIMMIAEKEIVIVNVFLAVISLSVGIYILMELNKEGDDDN